MDTKLENKNSKISQELLFVMYFWGFALLRPILKGSQNYSTLILFIYVFIIVIISFKKSLHSPQVLQSFVIVGVVFFILLFDMLFRPNEVIPKYMYEFTIFGAIPIYLISQVKDVKKMLKLFSLLSLIVYLMYCMDPIRGYAVTDNYMSFGFDVALPAYFGLFTGRRLYHIKWMFPFEVLCLLELVLFANRSAILSIIVLWVTIELFYERRSAKKAAKMLLFISMGFISLVFLRDVISWTILLLDRFEIYSASLQRIQQYIFQSDWVRLFSGRIEIWDQANAMIKDNIFFGSGTGAFQVKYDVYPHNLYFDVMTQYGLIGLSVLVSLIINSFHNIFRNKDHSKFLGLLLFCLWFPKLMLSIYFFQDIGIWCFLVYGFIRYKNPY